MLGAAVAKDTFMQNKTNFDNHEQLALEWLRDAIACIENGALITSLRVQSPTKKIFQPGKQVPELEHTGEIILTVGYKSSVSSSES